MNYDDLRWNLRFNDTRIDQFHYDALSLTLINACITPMPYSLSPISEISMFRDAMTSSAAHSRELYHLHIGGNIGAGM